MSAFQPFVFCVPRVLSLGSTWAEGGGGVGGEGVSVGAERLCPVLWLVVMASCSPPLAHGCPQRTSRSPNLGPQGPAVTSSWTVHTPGAVQVGWGECALCGGQIFVGLPSHVRRYCCPSHASGPWGHALPPRPARAPRPRAAFYVMDWRVVVAHGSFRFRWSCGAAPFLGVSRKTTSVDLVDPPSLPAVLARHLL